MSTAPIVRYATENDVSGIFALIKELAVFENALHSVQTDEASLSKTLSFPKSDNAVQISDFTPGFARTFLVIVPKDQAPAEAADSPLLNDGYLAGMALFFTNYSTWRGAPGVYLEDLYVRHSFRRKGYAKLLLKTLAEETLRLGGKRLEWSCLKWNEGALTFYNSIGAQRMEEWVGLRVDNEALDKLARR